jgi:hypothetical protein
MADASSALRKLQSNQALTDAEYKLLGLSVPTPTPTPIPTPTPTPTPTPITAQLDAGEKPDSYYTKVLASGKTQAQIDALRNAYDVSALIGSTVTSISQVTGSTVDKLTGKVVTTYKDPNMIQMLNGILYKGGIPFTGDQGDTRYVNGQPTETYDRENGKWVPYTGSATTSSSTTNNNTTSSSNINNALLQQLLAERNAAAQAAALTKEKERQSIIAVLQDRFSKYGLTGLANKIKELAIDGATEATITLSLQATDEYKMRFKANEVRIKNGLTVLQPAEYLNLEDGYRQVLRAYGLKAFDNDEYVQQFIANDVSAAELSNRVVTAVQRVQNADPAVSKQLRDFYGIGSGDLVAYVLDPQQQFQKIERQVAASEIGVAAGRQGLSVGVGVAEQLAAQGVSMAEAQKGYATIADILPTAEKLSAIYGDSSGVTYGQSSAEQEVFNSLASAQRARQKLTGLEVGTFGSKAGTNMVSLTSGKSAGQI